MKNYDVIIIGAGAAGLMTAIIAARRGLNVALLDSRKIIGAKILMSGGTRCNVTNKTITINDYNSHHLNVVEGILRQFTNKDTIKFFEKLNVHLVLEDTDKYFPTTHTAKTVLAALIKAVEQSHVDFKTESKVDGITFDQNMFTVMGEGFSYQAPQIALATGGLSYPNTGSDGSGYKMAKTLSHRLHQTYPALTPLLSDDSAFKQLSGISLNVNLSLKANSKKVFSRTDGFLFTHHGFSGPIALDISRHWLTANGEKKIIANFLPQFNEEQINKELQILAKNPKKTIKNFITQFLPERLSQALLSKAGIKPATLLNQLTKPSRMAFIETCLHNPLDVKGVVGYSKAEVTAGGIDLSQLNPRTLESNLHKGLYFVGEICDVDGRIGGFNFQWAWASGYVVGNSIQNKEK